MSAVSQQSGRVLTLVLGFGSKPPTSSVWAGGSMDATMRPIIVPTHKSFRSRASTSPEPSPRNHSSFNCEIQGWHTGDAHMGEVRDQQERHAPNTTSTTPRHQLANRLQQLEFHPFLESRNLDQDVCPIKKSRTSRSSSPHSLLPTQTSSMPLQSRATASMTFQQDLADVALLPSAGQWAASAHALTSARLLMWDQARQQHSHSSRPDKPSSSGHPPTQTDTNTVRFAPFHDARHHTGSRVYTMENQVPSTTGHAEEKTEDMEIDVLLDDASLDMLVTALARETARIEAASGVAGRHSVLRQQIKDVKHEDEDDDNQRSEHDRGDDSDFSSADSSNPSTPSTSSSNTSALRTNGKGKAKPKRVRRACVVPGCGKRSRSLGLCIAHGGGRRCVVAGCDKSSQGGNLCIKHGGGKRCSVEGCDKAAQTNSLCKAHGGGPRCQFGDCQKSSQGGGFCRQHGGGKRCAFEGCMKGTQRGSYCALHGGSRLCVVEGCQRNDRGGGYCAHHGGGRRCTVVGCTRPSRRNSLCSTHLRVLGPNGPNLEELNQSIDQGIKRTLASRSTSPSLSLSPSPSPSPPAHSYTSEYHGHHPPR